MKMPGCVGLPNPAERTGLWRKLLKMEATWVEWW
jgi:hypothetical protein